MRSSILCLKQAWNPVLCHYTIAHVASSGKFGSLLMGLALPSVSMVDDPQCKASKVPKSKEYRWSNLAVKYSISSLWYSQPVKEGTRSSTHAVCWRTVLFTCWAWATFCSPLASHFSVNYELYWFHRVNILQFTHALLNGCIEGAAKETHDGGERQRA